MDQARESRFASGAAAQAIGPGGVPEQLRSLIEAPPKLHVGPAKVPINYGLPQSVLRRFAEIVVPGTRTIETGTGLSTITFAIVGTVHTAISPVPLEHIRIRAYCEAHGIPLDQVTFVEARSEDALPSIVGTFDFALIDGDHAFPVPILDYFHLNARLALDGILAVDDLFIPSVKMLHHYLLTEPAYEFLGVGGEHTGLYRKTKEPSGWWGQQPMNDRLDFSYLSWRARMRRYAGKVPVLPALYRRLKPRR